MPKPHPDKETESEWMARCMHVVMHDGTAQSQDQGVAICMDMWRRAKEGKTRMERLNITFDVKSLTDGEFEGYGSTFGNIDLGGDVVLKGAFKQSLADHEKTGSMPQMFWMHQPDKVPGKWIKMAEDAKGLYVKGVLAKTELGNEMQALLTMKAVRGLSIGYAINDRQKDVSYDGDGNRLLKKIDLWEVSLVSLAMNPLAQVQSAKSRLSDEGEYVPTERELEQHLRDAGCSRSVAKSIIARLYDDDLAASGMPVGGHRRDAGTVANEDDDIAKYLDKMTDSLAAEIFKR